MPILPDVTDPKAPPHSLSPSQEAALAVLIDPRYFKASVAQQAEAAGISRAQFYRLRKDPVVLAAIRDAMGARIIQRLPRVIDAMLKSAMIPGKNGHGDRKLLAELSGIYSRYGRRAPAPDENKDQGREFGAGLVEALNQARQQSAQARQEVAQAPVEGFDKAVEIFEGEWQDDSALEPTTSGDIDPSEEAEIT